VRLLADRVHLAVTDAAAGVHHLQLAGVQVGRAAGGVAVTQRAAHHVGDDLHVAMRVRGEAGVRRDAVLVDHAQRAVAHPARVVVLAERK
jgi:hypothetical protein